MVRNALSRFSYVLDRSCRVAAVGFLTVMLGLVLFQVVARYLFQSVPVWTEEAARYCMVWGGLLGATAAFRADSDPRLIQPPKSGPKVKIALATWIRATGAIVFLGPVLYHSDRFLMRTWYRTSEALGISTMWVTLAVPVAVIIIFCHLAAKLMASATGRLPDQD
jgi:TRAP-type C4-dicarboxylate transport system permease small subunit